VNVGTNTTYTASGLPAKTQYQFKVSAYCPNATTKGYSKAVKAKTLKCSAVINPLISDITSSSAQVSWQAQCSSSSYKVRYRTTLPLSAWIVLQNISTTSTIISSLTAETSYELQAASKCGNDTSLWSSSVFFSTLSEAPTHPNILFILEDDGRYDTFPSTGGPSFFQTPAINRIANEGINFKYMIPATSQCTPSRCTFYTGLYPHKHGATKNGGVMTPGLPLIQQILHNNGYYTGFLGKYGQNGEPVGFDWYAKSNSLEYINPSFSLNGSAITLTDSSHYTDVIQKYALQFLDSVPQGMPFMLMYFTIIPHSPTVPRRQEGELYDDDEMPFPSNFAKYSINYPSYLYGSGTKWPDNVAVTDSMRRIEFETTKGLDYSVDTLFQKLEAKGILDNTLIIFTSDNGYLKGEHLLEGKEIAYEESIRLPLFIRYPAWFNAGTVINNEIASNLDIAPTMLEAAGIPDTFDMDGVSLHQLAQHSVSRKDFMYEFPMADGLAAIRAVRGLQYKYIRSYCTSSTEEFYNLYTDPHEDTNQIFKSSYAALIQTYRNKLDSLRSAFADVTLPLTSCNLKNPVFREEEEEFTASTSLSLFPNPASQTFVISIPASDEHTKTEIEVHDLFGRMVMKKSLATNSITLDCNSWSSGSYVVKAICGEEVYFGKLVVPDR
jgi:N-acetylglucosamine-6-sulfatase